MGLVARTPRSIGLGAGEVAHPDSKKAQSTQSIKTTPGVLKFWAVWHFCGAQSWGSLVRHRDATAVGVWAWLPGFGQGRNLAHPYLKITLEVSAGDSYMWEISVDLFWDLIMSLWNRAGRWAFMAAAVGRGCLRDNFDIHDCLASREEVTSVALHYFFDSIVNYITFCWACILNYPSSHLAWIELTFNFNLI